MSVWRVKELAHALEPSVCTAAVRASVCVAAVRACVCKAAVRTSVCTAAVRASVYTAVVSVTSLALRVFVQLKHLQRVSRERSFQ